MRTHPLVATCGSALSQKVPVRVENALVLRGSPQGPPPRSVAPPPKRGTVSYDHRWKTVKIEIRQKAAEGNKSKGKKDPEWEGKLDGGGRGGHFSVAGLDGADNNTEEPDSPAQQLALQPSGAADKPGTRWVRSPQASPRLTRSSFSKSPSFFTPIF